MTRSPMTWPTELREQRLAAFNAAYPEIRRRLFGLPPSSTTDQEEETA